MKKKSVTIQRNKLDDMVRFICFLVFGTMGMGVIGLALLSEPIKGYYTDRAFIDTQQRKIEQLQKLIHQQDELLANAANPAVIERAAVSNFKYIPVSEQGAQSIDLPHVWGDLKQALAQIDEVAVDPPEKPWQLIAQNLAGQPERQILLMGLGAALVIMALSCFYRRSYRG